jgi:hypothetical protein
MESVPPSAFGTFPRFAGEGKQKAVGPESFLRLREKVAAAGRGRPCFAMFKTDKSERNMPLIGI